MTDGTRRPSGEHKAVKAFRAKLESLDEHTLEELRALNQKLEAKLETIPPPATDNTDTENEEGDDHGSVD